MSSKSEARRMKFLLESRPFYTECLSCGLDCSNITDLSTSIYNYDQCAIEIKGLNKPSLEIRLPMLARFNTICRAFGIEEVEWAGD